MKKLCLALLFISLGACSNQPKNVKITSNYEYGFSVSDTPEMIGELKKIGDICLELNPSIQQIQPIMRKNSNWF